MKIPRTILLKTALTISMFTLLNGGPETDHLLGPNATEVFDDTFDTLCQKLIEKTHEFFATRQLHLFDGSDGANQCHINALMVTLLALHEASTLSETEWRFLALNLLLNKSTEGNERPEMLGQLLGLPITGKIKNALKSGKAHFIMRAKHELLTCKERFFDEHLSPFADSHLWRALAFEQNGMSILPKFVGIWCLLAFLKRVATLWTIIKCHLPNGDTIMFCITPDQQRLLPASAMQSLAPDIPVIVIEGITTTPERLCAIPPTEVQLANAAAWMIENQPSDCIRTLPTTLRPPFENAMHCARTSKIGPAKDIASDAVFSIHHMFPSVIEKELT